ncbi:type IV toxin-antitoxin system AbiEi family antitoxin domain-containing protein [Streptacidiphilus sp. EB129]|uniref:type IV toxin-antitoxin system AbiEi family antitoxin domain-containing protein n=1 Tax=Streptacidiphilus sp. EB129 TaxID=3156262 RepID=UPI003513455C
MERQEALQVLGGLSADQWGLVTAAQASDVGIGKMTMSRLVAAGLLNRVGHGVYSAVAAGLPSHLEIRVAWLRLDPGRPAWQRQLGDQDSGVVSHASACLLHGIGDLPAPTLDITVPRVRTTREADVRLLPGDIPVDDITVVDGLPVTTAERTIVDLLAERIDGGHIGGVIADAQRSGLLDIPSLARRVAHQSDAYGAPAGDGRALLAVLLENVGEHLRDDQAMTEAVQVGALQATELIRESLSEIMALPNPGLDGVREVLAQMSLRNEAVHAAAFRDLMAPAEASLARAISPVLHQLNDHLAQLLAPLATQLPRDAGQVLEPLAASMREVEGQLAESLQGHILLHSLRLPAVNLADIIVPGKALKVPVTAWSRASAAETNQLPRSAATPTSTSANDQAA